MSSIEQHGRRVHRWAHHDRRGRQSRQRVEWLYAGILLCCSLGFFLFGLKAGLYLEPYHVPGEVSSSQPNSVKNSTEDHLRIDGYKFVFQSEESERFAGSTIGQVNYLNPNTIYIQKGMDSDEVYSTCVHEKLHLLRLEKDSEDMHDWIYEHEDVIPDSTCFELIRYRFGSESVDKVRQFVESRFESKLSLESQH